MRKSLALVLLPVALSLLLREASAEETLQEKEDKAEKFLLVARTTTRTSYIMSTTTAYVTCLSGSAPVLCQGRAGRRRKRSKIDMIDRLDEGTMPALDSSSADLEEKNLEELGTSKGGDDKLLNFMQLWTRTVVTTTLTTTYINSSSTVRVSYYCLAGAVSLPTMACPLG